MEKVNLPEGREWLTLSEVIGEKGVFVDGDWVESKDQDKNGSVRLIQLADVGDGHFRDKSDRYLTKEKARELSCTFLEKGDVLVARMPDPLGRSCIFPFEGAEKFVTVVDVCILRLDAASHDNRFISYLVNSPRVRNAISDLESGTTRKRISRKNLATISLPIPPLAEQQRIVAKLEELFSELDAGKQQLEKAAQGLKVYRQAVLKWAFEGRLTNADMVDGELPGGWKWQRLCDYIESIGAGKSFKCDERPPKEGEVGIVKVSSVTWGYFDEEESKTCFSNDSLNPAYLIKKDDFLFSRANTIDLIGACVIAGEVKRTLMLSDKILRIKFAEQLSQKYALHYLRSRKGRSEIENLSTGNQESMRNIGQEKIKQISIPICPLEEQHRIVQEIEARLSACDKIEGTIAQSLQQAEALRQSILKKAFEGKLLAQKRAKIIPFFPVVEEDDNHLRKVFAAYIISRCYNDRYFGRVVFQKMLHLAEYHCQLDYQTHYLQQAAGPLDKFIYRLIEEAAEKEWFSVYERGKQQRFEPGRKLPELLQDYTAHFAPYQSCLEQVFGLMKGRNMDAAELFSTVYAVWNNCIIQAVAPDKARIVREVHAWSDRKEKYNEAQIWDARGVLERAGLAPVGFGKTIEKN